MGCDGGSIPKRKEIVKSKQRDETVDKQTDLASKWHFCALSALPLTKPIVSCPLGRLYNKDAIIHYLLDLKGPINKPSTSQIVTPAIASHIKSLKDIRELRLKEKPEADLIGQKVVGGTEKFRAKYICPISGLDFNGRYKFFYSIKCGCVISEKALREVPDDNLCIVCSLPYDSKDDLVIINGNQYEVEDLMKRLEIKRRNMKKIKRSERSESSKTKEDPKSSLDDDERGTHKRSKIERVH